MEKQSSLVGIKRLQSLIRIHIESFNFAISQGFRLIVHDFFRFSHKKEKNSDSYFLDFHLAKPCFSIQGRAKKAIPRQCKETNSTYKGNLLTAFSFFGHSKKKKRFIFKSGDIPIMVRSIKCNLFELKSNQLIEIDEEEYETGGYFILNGLEKILRLLIVPKRNAIQVISRIGNSQRGELCTVFSCSIRSVDRIQTSKTFHLHYLTSGGVHFRIVLKKQEFFIPVVILIRALRKISDREILEKITESNYKDNFSRKRALIMIKDAHEKCEKLEQTKAQEFLGKVFRIALPFEKISDTDLGKLVISKYILIHLGGNNEQKQLFIIFMIQKLLSVRKGLSSEDNPDSIETQEFLLPGNLILVFLKEKIENSLRFSTLVQKDCFLFDFEKKIPKTKQLTKTKNLEKLFYSISNGLEHLISTGSFASGFKNELSQTTGLSVNIERLNFGRFLSYFRSIHRGKFFSELKNTAGRKLFPQSWGFICPVHTPDGAPCGILNHVSSSVITSVFNPIEKKIFKKYLLRVGFGKFFLTQTPKMNKILLDGQVIGFGPDFFLRWLLDKLRIEKVSFNGILPIGCEIFCIFRPHQKTFSPHLNISSQEARPLRPSRWIESKKNFGKNQKKKRNYLSYPKNKNQIEMIGASEQGVLLIKNSEYQVGFFKDDIFSTHFEIDALGILSVIAGATPFSDLNQSPRNIYQCQMAKQSIGTPYYTFWRKNESKSYFLLTPQVPICRNKVVQDGLQLDAFPSGINAVVSVLTYTGFDMEDGLILNRCSIQRGFSMANISSSISIDVKPKKLENQSITKSQSSSLSRDGYPEIESCVSKGDPLYLDQKTSGSCVVRELSLCYNGSEKAIIEQVKFYSRLLKKEVNIKSSLKLRYRRKPVVGDKFASRHGQKGVLSYDFISSDLPFSEIGIIPDIIFNPHGFPSRMTIGVILESIAGKLGSLDGTFQDSSPFRFFQDRISSYYFGEKLRQLGFQFFGNEVFYSGYSGEPFKMDIFTGLVQYQRLRHMVLDKFQVSENGPRNFMTRQPTKGRKMGGAVRFGEMERDALLGHGCTYLLHDRIQTSSDLHSSFVEIKTGQFLNYKKISKKIGIFPNKPKFQKEKLTRRILVPYVMKYLIAELAAINIRISMSLEEN